MNRLPECKRTALCLGDMASAIQVVFGCTWNPSESVEDSPTRSLSEPAHKGGTAHERRVQEGTRGALDTREEAWAQWHEGEAWAHGHEGGGLGMRAGCAQKLSSRSTQEAYGRQVQSLCKGTSTRGP